MQLRCVCSSDQGGRVIFSNYQGVQWHVTRAGQMGGRVIGQNILGRIDHKHFSTSLNISSCVKYDCKNYVITFIIQFLEITNYPLVYTFNPLELFDPFTFKLHLFIWPKSIHKYMIWNCHHTINLAFECLIQFSNEALQQLTLLYRILFQDSYLYSL